MSTRACRTVRRLPFKLRDSSLAPRVSGVHRIADAHGGAGCRTECRVDGAKCAYAKGQRPAPHLAKRPAGSFNFQLRGVVDPGDVCSC